MEQSNSGLFRTVLQGSQHDYTAISHDRKKRPSQDEPSGQNDLLDYDHDDWNEPTTRSESPLGCAQNNLVDHDGSNETIARSESPLGCTQGRKRRASEDAEKLKALKVPTANLHRSGYVLFLVLIYIGLALASWVITCYLSFRPITANHYGEWIWNNGNNGYGWSSSDYMISLYQKNERWYRTARVIQSIVSVLTIPVTSAVCSSAAVIFIQKQHARSLSMRQVIAIADKGWTDIATYLRILPLFGTRGWKRYGSSFLLLAMFINILGSVISPLQEIFLSTKSIKVPTFPAEVLNILDIPDQWTNTGDNEHDANLVVTLTRSLLESANNAERQGRLWEGANISCALTEGAYELPLSCNRGGVTFGNMSQLEHPFLAQLPSGYSTGLIQQFLPRINSTAQYQNISGSEFPKGCDRIDGAFFVNYYKEAYNDGFPSIWGLQACMPANVTKSPWKPTRDRQDFREDLYLNVTIIGTETNYYSTVNSSFYKITLDTTAGYFELPNYMNGEVAGPLLEKDPNGICGNSCEIEGVDDIYNHGEEPKVRRSNETIDDDASRPLETVINKGPLLTIAMALFGEGSFIQDRQENPQAYASHLPSGAGSSSYSYPSYGGACISLAPLGYLLADQLGQGVIGNGVDACISNSDGGTNSSNLDQEVASWLSNFNYDEERLSNAFTSAAFLANQVWMDSNVVTGRMSLTITFDLGFDTKVPIISRGGLILVSILLGLDILILVPLAVYATLTPRWTSTMDSFAMMRMGAAVADKVPLLIGQETDKISALDEISGCVGDVSKENDLNGRLGLGAPRPLASRKNKRFECYEGDREHFPNRAQDVRVHQRAYQEGRRNLQM